RRRFLFATLGPFRKGKANPVEVTTLKKPRSQERGSLFYGGIERAQNFGKKQRTSPHGQASFLICSIGLLGENRR
ncbi:hypothetical protein K8352_10495, partial [Flavobacteriaceae bacterium F89]